ncbi:unnamed protein product [Peronospora destructor]|uniref:Uncharacterized protein n=1 Tax=Peronospora destructor TaxID=86335 RepID=A0AAV0US53_9STRA|nr:unnamed protein product [Peronospora destructor]
MDVIKHAAVGTVIIGGTGRKLPTHNGRRFLNAPQAAAVAAAVTSLLLEAERKTVVVSHTAVEAALILIKKFTLLADIKCIDIPLGALAAGPVTNSWIYQSDAFAKSQLAALDSFFQLPSDVLRRMRDEMPSEKLVSRCDVFHRGQTCTQFHSDYFVKGMKLTIRLYVPIYAVSVLGPKYNRWIWGPATGTRIASGALPTYLLLPYHAVASAAGCFVPVPDWRQLVLLSGAMAVIFQHTTPDSSRMVRMLYGHNDKPALTPQQRVRRSHEGVSEPTKRIS